MPIDLLPNVASPYQLPEHEGDPDAPRFHLRALSSRTMLELQGIENNGSAMFAMLCASLVGIDNVTQGGEPLDLTSQPERRLEGVRIPAGSLPVATVEMLPPVWVALLAGEVARRHTVTPEDLGK